MRLVEESVELYKVNSNQSSLQLPNLKPDKKYEVWISANTIAGEGNRTYTFFTTAPSGISFPLTLLRLSIMCCLMAKKIKWINIPDPINSSSFKQLSNQVRKKNVICQ
ncbi:hypothetical protein Q7C36_017449 [Tachysurus vachellii]|uniref:Fibronectin type-III domain-containing protein n=1 Tax=Tachysurus vachellii TaxID=175792 RepID=A0AA88M3F2_TACVA|nr:hypothetical protein Q7C36_017449 [Tachysurus vachellii]